MNRIVFALIIVLAMSGVACASVILDYVENPSPGSGLKSYTVRATGIGITTLSQFTIDGNVYQEFLDPSTQSPWLGDESADPFGTGRDSYICFGEVRIPDLAGLDGPGNGNPISTTETVLDGSASGPGTLNNYDGEQMYDAYLYMGSPSGEMETRDLYHLVLAEGESVTIALRLLSVIDHDPETGNATIIVYDFFDSNNLVVPEPGCVVLLIVGGLWLVGCRRRKRS